MNRRMLTIISVVVLCAVALCMSLTGRKVSAQSASVYNPYPPGILPSNLSSEIARVLAEVDFIEARAIARWQALTPPTLTGQPPILQNTGTEAVEALGELMNYDRRISPERNQACASCHMPYVAFSGPIPSVNLTMIAYPGTAHFRAGKRSAQRYPYAPFFPVLQYNQEQGLFFGGNFWDSRATGYLLRNPDAHQAQGPPVDTQEMGNPDTACITFKLSKAVYRPLFELVWGKGSFDISFPANTADICATPGGAAVFGGSATPVQLSAVDRIRSNEVYNHWGQSIDAYEQSLQVSAFSSKFDAFLKGKYTLTANEKAGYDLFRGKGNCNSCHLDGRSTAPAPTAPASEDTGVAAQVNPLFTCFGSANEGLPLNPRDAIYYQNTPDSFGFHFPDCSSRTTGGGPDTHLSAFRALGRRHFHRAKSIDSSTFKVSTNVAMAMVTVHAGGLRELHWHPNADEWQYYISGKARMTVVSTGNKARTMDFQAGDVGYVEKTLLHYIENTGDTDLIFLEMFKSGFYQDLSLSEWLAHTPPELVMAHLNIDKTTLDAIPRDELVIVPR